MRIVDAIDERVVAMTPAKVSVWSLAFQAHVTSNKHVGFPFAFSLGTTTMLALCSDLGCELVLLDMAVRPIREETGLDALPPLLPEEASTEEGHAAP
jgi:hypothetical protein